MGSSRAGRRLLVAGLFAATVVTVAAAVVGLDLRAYRIDSGSMEPDFPVGTIVIVSGRVPPALHKAVTFQIGDRTVTHVLVGYGSDGTLVTRGLANPANDDWRPGVRLADVRGSVVAKVLVLAPSFWVSRQGIAAGTGVAMVAGAGVLMRTGHRKFPARRFRRVVR